ncbi:hypothetical protein H8356DRAFT_1433444 [Neocallimastix lanati (nom. inval.)]|nr:hypothetical protein H8356DRAFT_1433444 [Neocallimastix sp. JGI-2020a]
MKIFNFALLAISALAFDLTFAARCGQVNGLACPTGYCCSQFGFCGKTESYCGKGCQSEFGICNGTTSSVADATTTTTTGKKYRTVVIPVVVTKVKHHHHHHHNKSTIISSTSNFATTTTTTTTAIADIKPTNDNVSTDDTCGPLRGNKICPEGKCCSEYGYCGDTDEYCGKGCLSEFGRCNSDATASSTTTTTSTKKSTKTKTTTTTTTTKKSIKTKTATTTTKKSTTAATTTNIKSATSTLKIEKPKNFVCVDCIGCIDCDVQPKMALYCPQNCKVKKPVYCIQCVNCVDCDANPLMAINCPNTCIKKICNDVSLDSEKDYDNNIYYYILSALLVDNIFFKQSSTSSTVPYFVRIAEFLTNVIPLICRSFSLMMKWYSVESTVTKCVDVSMIRHGFSPPDNTNSEIITRNNGRGVIIEEWEKLEAIASNALL